MQTCDGKNSLGANKPWRRNVNGRPESKGGGARRPKSRAGAKSRYGRERGARWDGREVKK